ncbi:cytochrome P450 3A5 [Gaeumannomyces tritici R3-111a-1]|uniref:Cytochrome P450 3A5 n=1 Tax=Gaeumannomyces tritici (strain R3-111a-1) TaxID=644352 RepID=J3PC83_GAET3|nr:cytochrome P450 3A5 [Gaeumannomyces tritici R3-111a-1]EJT71853.1 cytochrome P450 3A5 [Gaeumannomyces tritici R3-111a-1]
MDLNVIAVVSALQTVVLLPKDELFGLSAVKVWLGLMLAQCLLTKMYSICIYPHFVSPLRHLPGPKDNHFFVGQAARLMMAAGPHDLYEEWARKWPDAPFIRQLSVGNQELLIVNSLAAQREVLGTHGNDFVKSDLFNRLFGEIIPGGLLFTKGEEHKRRRRALAGPMSLPKIRRLVPVFQEKARGWVNSLQSGLDAGGDGVWEVEYSMHELLLEMIVVTVLGVELAQMESPSSMGFAEAYHNLLQPSKLSMIIWFVNAMGLPMRWLPLKSNKKWLEANFTIQSMIKDVAHRRAENLRAAGRRRDAEDVSDTRRDLTTFMLEESLFGKGELSESEIANGLLELVGAAHDTSSSAITWIIFQLAARPEMQERCRVEVLAVTDDIDAGMLENLPFLDKFIKEVLRMYSPTIVSLREAAKDMVIEGVPIAKGTSIVISPANIGRNPKVWGPDADTFDPDRWSRLEGDAASPYAFGAFNNGPRICPGRQQAMLQMKAILCELLRAFHLEPVDTALKFQNPTVMLKPKGKLRVRARRLEM